MNRILESELIVFRSFLLLFFRKFNLLCNFNEGKRKQQVNTANK